MRSDGGECLHGDFHASFHNDFNSKRHPVGRKTFKKRHSAAPAKWRSFASQTGTSRMKLHPVETGSRSTDSLPMPPCQPHKLQLRRSSSLTSNTNKIAVLRQE